METRKSLQLRSLWSAALMAVVASPALGAQHVVPRAAAPIHVCAEVVGTGEAARAAGMVDLVAQQLAKNPVTGSPAGGQLDGARLDTAGLLRVTLLDAEPSEAEAAFSHVTILVEYVAN